jgi:alpha-L-rhamnosidase
MKFKKVPIFFILIIAVFIFSFKEKKKAVVQLQNLRCEMLVNPEGIDATKPRLSWEIISNERNVQQAAFQIIVASSLDKLNDNKPDIWNSGKISSNESINVSYNGPRPKSTEQCFWKVKVYTNKGESDWSVPAYWSMGLLHRSDWKAKWTGLDRSFAWDSITKFARLSARYFRKDFTAKKEIKRATVYICGLGLYELYINGNKIGDQVLAPSPTDYEKVVKYNTFDVTGNLKDGENAIGTILGNGRFFAMRQNYKPKKWHTFGFPKMILQLEIEYKDGSKQYVVSDDTWKVTANGPIRTNNEYDGEEYDATKELNGWNKPDYNDSKWLKAELVKSPGGKIEAQMNENMKVMQTLKPVSIKKIYEGKYILDIGQNMAGWLKIKVRGKRGDKVTLKFAESLQPDGELYRQNLRDAKATDVYTLKGTGEETWNPAFVFHGFRYAEITGYPGTPSINDFVGEVVYDDMRTIGSFETSNKTINQIYQNAYWGIRSNYKGMPIDCPQRNERQPWLGDRATGSYGESFIFDNEKLYAKWLDDIEESQTAEGSIPDVAPNFWYYYKDDVTWPATYLMVADMLYNQFADRQAVVKHYASMKKWMNYMKNKYMKNYLFSKDSYGDWCVPPESPELIHAKDPARITNPELLASATYYHLLQLMQRFAKLTGMKTDSKEFASLSVKIKEAFNKTFYNKQTKSYSNNTVTANILPLAFKMVPDGESEYVFKHIADKTMNENNGHISTGVIGTQWLMRWLTYYGRADIAYRLATVTSYPGWGYMVANGATTIWELWNGNTANPKMNSQNHVMLLGDLIVWMYEDLAGIKTSTMHPGFKVIEMKPAFVDSLSYVKASYHSMYGVIKSEWEKSDDQFSWKITVPCNSKALVYVPASSANNVLINGKNPWGIPFVIADKKSVVFTIGSGDYEFVVKK